ncbi:LytR family transcriptional regulator, partial [Streptomyces sp. SID7909]|nr:LytR family transcriptional regulator [Streptomyces sp. SID7909]
MNDWPDGWTDDNRSGNRYGQGSASERPESARSMPHVQRRPAPPPQRPAPP